MSAIHTSSGAIVYKKENGVIKVLLLRRLSTNSWHLPKGTQNPGETLEQTALREIREETGYTVELGKYLGKLESTFERNGAIVNKETHYFLAQPASSPMEKHDGEHEEVLFIEYPTALRHLEDFSLYEKEGRILKMAEPCFA